MSPLDRQQLVKSLFATAALLALFMSPLPQPEGVLIVAGCLLLSRKMATKSLLGLVDWHLLVLFAGLFVVTRALTATGRRARPSLLWRKRDWHPIGSRF
jgi:Na+/H+ antiporter NhaD/arsenite permease-like protein